MQLNLKLWAETKLGVKAFQLFGVRVCGQEVLSLLKPSRPEFFRLTGDSNGTPNQWRYTNEFLSGWFGTNETIHCIIMGYRILYKDGAGNMQNYTGGVVSAGGSIGQDLIITT